MENSRELSRKEASTDAVIGKCRTASFAASMRIKLLAILDVIANFGSVLPITSKGDTRIRPEIFEIFDIYGTLGRSMLMVVTPLRIDRRGIAHPNCGRLLPHDFPPGKINSLGDAIFPVGAIIGGATGRL